MLDDGRLQAYLGSLPLHQASAWKRRLDDLRTDCGCRTGAVVMLSCTGAWLIYSVLSPVAGRTWQRAIVHGLAVLLASGIAGKLIGLALARVRLHLTVRRLRSNMGTAQGM